MNEISLTESLQQTLFRIPLFEGAPESLRASLTERLDARLYALEKNEIVAHQGTVCRVLYVLLEGRVRTDLVDEWGNRVMIETIVAPRSFATPHLFSRDQTLPATFIATMPSTLLMAPRESVFRLISEEPYLLKNFLHVYRCLIVAQLRHHSAYEQRKDHTKHSSSHCLVLHCLINGCKGRGYSVHRPSYLLRRRARTLP